MTQYLLPRPPAARSMTIAVNRDAPTRPDSGSLPAAQEIPVRQGVADCTDRLVSCEEDSMSQAGMIGKRWFAAVRDWTASVMATMSRRGHDNVMRQFHQLDQSAKLESSQESKIERS